MFQTCLYCHANLGQNPLIEHCPIGQRLAFDPAKGRLWVVCRACERWNLTPFEDRWEALEDCERRFRGTRLRYSTANIGLARLEAGMELVRIGEPLRPEMAAWRYGDQFGRRRRRHLLISGAVVLGAAGAVAGAVSAVTIAGVGTAALWQVGLHARNFWRWRHSVAVLPTPDGRVRRLNQGALDEVALLRGEAGGWCVRIPERFSPLDPDPAMYLTGEHAFSALRHLMPRINRAGGSAADVRDAVDRLESMPDLEDQIADMADHPRYSALTGECRQLNDFNPDTRLALEMLLHESFEERSLRGELWRLERAWKEAEEIARIADGLLVPDDVELRLKPPPHP